MQPKRLDRQRPICAGKALLVQFCVASAMNAEKEWPASKLSILVESTRRILQHRQLTKEVVEVQQNDGLAVP